MLQNHKGIYKIQNPEKYIGDSKNVFYRSSWEKRLMLFFDLNQCIKKWSSEDKNCIVPYIGPDNKKHRYFIDFYIETSNENKYLIEVKPNKKLCKPTKKSRYYLHESIEYVRNQLKFEAGHKFAQSRSMQYLVITEKHVKFDSSDSRLYQDLSKLIIF